MDLLEYQGKELFAEHGVPITPQVVCSTAQEAHAAADRLGGQVVVKAQVKVGGRGKAGGVKLADTPDEAEAHARAILGMDIKGHTVRQVLVTEARDIADEYYASFLLDRSGRTFLAMASREGGVEIEEVAATKPEALARVSVDPAVGVDAALARRIATEAQLPSGVVGPSAELLERLWEVFTAEEATLVEVNPMVATPAGEVLALDGKVTLDDNAAFRHPGHAAYADSVAADPLEARAKARNLNYVKLDGEVGIIGNGAGLVMSTLDVVAYAGESYGGIKPANFLDIGGGASAEVMASGLEIVLGDPSVRAVLINIFGGITEGDKVANGIVQGLKMFEEAHGEVTVPLVVRLDGNRADEGRAILTDAAPPSVRPAETMDGAAELAAQLASGAAARGA